MRSRWLGGFAAVALAFGLVVGCDGGAVEPPEELRMESEHFVFKSNTANSSEAEMSEGLIVGEDLFAGISAFIGSSRTPAVRITVHLDGDYATQGSHVDFDGVHLVRYAANEDGYWAVFAHELAHAFGVDWFIAHEAWDWSTYRFFDEGFAEYVAQEVDPEKGGFPFFGYPEDVIAGHWVTTGTAIPPHVLREQHDRLNDRCGLQAYTERASWFRFVDGNFGRAAVLAIVYGEAEPTTDVVRGITGAGLEDLDREWAEWIRDRHASVPDAADVAMKYRERTPWYTTCLAGVDY